MNTNEFLDEAINAGMSYPNALTRSELYQISYNTKHAVPSVLCASLVTQKNISNMRVGFKPTIRESQFSNNSRLLFLSKEDAQQFLDLCRGNPELPRIDAFEVKKARSESVLVRIDNNFDFPIYCNIDYVNYIFDKDPDRFDGMLLTTAIKDADHPEKDSNLEQRIEKRQTKKAAILHANKIIMRELQRLFTKDATRISFLEDTIDNKTFRVSLRGYRIDSIKLAVFNLCKEVILKNLSWTIYIELPGPTIKPLTIKNYNTLFFTNFYNAGSIDPNRCYYAISNYKVSGDYKYSSDYKNIINGVNENSSEEDLKKACLKLHDYLLAIYHDAKDYIDDLFEEVEL